MAEQRSALRIAAATCIVALATPVLGTDLQVALDERKEANAASAESQKRVDTINDETEAMLVDYRATLKQLDSLNVYNGQMRELIAAQQEELESLQEQVDRVELVARAVTPLMAKMIASLESFVSLDVPFLEEERQRRMTDLKELMSRSDVSNSEKYRRLMEAYQIENEYGRTSRPTGPRSTRPARSAPSTSCASAGSPCSTSPSTVRRPAPGISGHESGFASIPATSPASSRGCASPGSRPRRS